MLGVDLGIVTNYAAAIASLREENASLRAENAALRLENASFREEHAVLREEHAALQEKLSAALVEIEKLRKGGRGAAPFSKNQPQPHPKKPGRRRGEGRFAHRAAPNFSGCDVTECAAEIDRPDCPQCGGTLVPEEDEEASTVILPRIRPAVQRFRIARSRCTCCNLIVRGTHPDLKPDQQGATAHRVEDRVYALAQMLHYATGIPFRKIPEVLHHTSGISLTHSALTQFALRKGSGPTPSAAAEPADEGAAPTDAVPSEPPAPGAERGPIWQIYQELRRLIRLEARVHTDDTSWRIGGQTAWLMVFCSVRLVVYQIRSRHRNEEVLEVIGAFFAGVLCTDRGSSYEALTLRNVRMQKCMSHLIRNVSDALGLLSGQNAEMAAAVRQLMRDALALWHEYRAGRTEGFAAKSRALLADADRLLEPISYLNPILDSLLNGIGRQHDRGNLFRFLEDPTIEPTNNLAERRLRPPIIARKVSQCSRTEAGAQAHAAWCSVIATL